MELLTIKPTRFQSAERFPVILSEAGMPQFYPNTFLTAKLRAENKQYRTLFVAADAVKVLRAWEMLEGVNVAERMMSCQFLQFFEADSLADAMWLRYDHLTKRLLEKNTQSGFNGKVRSLAAFRRQEKSYQEAASFRVRPGTAGCRMVYVLRYIDYLGKLGIQRERDAARRSNLAQELEQMLAALAARSPDAFGGHIDAEYRRLGLTYEVEGVLREVIEVNHPLNPWASQVRRRNRMVIQILFGLGCRGGELLNLRIDDIDLRQNKIHIRRLPDNPDDPRLYEPNVKTLSRDLKMKDAVADAIEEYLVNDRRQLKGARRHDFLVVSNVDGAPLSRNAFNHIFLRLRQKIPGIPLDFGAHLCRHTWNDRYSDFCDKAGVDEEKERKTRSRIMGWVPGSKMAAVYTKRSTQDEVDKFMLGQQQYIANGQLGALLNEITVDPDDE